MPQLSYKLCARVALTVKNNVKIKLIAYDQSDAIVYFWRHINSEFFENLEL